MAGCDPLDPDTWPDGYICVQHGGGEWTLEKSADDEKKSKSPNTGLLVGAALGLAIGIILSKR